MPIPSPSAVLLRTQSDERLVTLARAGHERAFEAIVERYRGVLARSARRYLPESRADDAVQQAFIAAWNALERGDDVRDLRAWLYRIVHNTALNQLRAAGYDYAELEDSLLGTDAPQEELERRAVVRQTLTGLAALPERQRDALLRIAVEGRSQEEVARELGVTEGAVRQLVHRARLTLRAAATAIVPLPVATWAAAAGASGGGPPMAERIGELLAGAGAGAFAVKAGTAAVIATTSAAVAGPAIIDSEAERAPRSEQRRVVRTPTPTATPKVTIALPTPTSTAGQGQIPRAERRREQPRARRRATPTATARPKATAAPTATPDRSGSSNSGPGSSSSGSGSSGSSSSGSSGSSGSGSSGSGSSGSGSSTTSGSGTSGSGTSGSSGSGTSGSGSSGSGSSGSGSATPTATPDNSGSGSSGSGSDDGLDSSGHGSADG